MVSNERNRLQRLLALLSLGITDALKEGIVSNNEAERLLFSPNTMRCCEKISEAPDLVHLIHVGTELDSIKRLVSLDQWNASIDTIRANARNVLTNTEPSDPQLDPWLPRLIDEYEEKAT